MCELLISAVNKTDTDSERDRRGKIKRGMFVAVMEDGHAWGRLESKQRWIVEGNTGTWPNQGALFIVKIPGVPASRAQALLETQKEDDSGIPTSDRSGPRIYRLRRWRLRLDNLPANVRNTIIAEGEITLTSAAQRQAFRDQLKRYRDDAQYTGFD